MGNDASGAEVGADEGLLFCNGLNASTGEYLLSEIPLSIVARVALGERLDPAERAALLARVARSAQRNKSKWGTGTRVIDGIDPTDLAQAGWGVVFPQDVPESTKDGLRPLLEHRRLQATASSERYREYTGDTGYRAGESANTFMERHGASLFDGANPAKMPYYLMLVGSPEEIPYEVQYQLDVVRAVGRIHFESADEYRRYAESVIAAESHPRGDRTATFFGTRHADDTATRLSSDLLVGPLAHEVAPRSPSWEIRTVLDGDATKARLRDLAGGAETPRFLFTACHGTLRPLGHPGQLEETGALVCQEWPGPVTWGQVELPPEFFFAARDVADDAHVGGMIAFFFACFGAGTPRQDDFLRQAAEAPPDIAPYPFVARLPQRLLAHPNGGALAVVGHVAKALGYSFRWREAGQLDSFTESVTRLLNGFPVGAAMEPFNERYATLTTALDHEKANATDKKPPNPGKLSMYWTAKTDARNYAIVGDPAVRLGPTPKDDLIRT